MAPGRRVLLGQFESRQALDQSGEDQLALEARQLRAQAVMDAAAERHRPAFWGADSVFVGRGVMLGIWVAPPKQHDDPPPRRQRAPADLDLGIRDTTSHLYRTIEAQQFLDGVRDQ